MWNALISQTALRGPREAIVANALNARGVQTGQEEQAQIVLIVGSEETTAWAEQWTREALVKSREIEDTVESTTSMATVPKGEKATASA